MKNGKLLVTGLAVAGTGLVSLLSATAGFNLATKREVVNIDEFINKCELWVKRNGFEIENVLEEKMPSLDFIKLFDGNFKESDRNQTCKV